MAVHTQIIFIILYIGIKIVFIRRGVRGNINDDAR